ncbi:MULTISPECIES: ABC transporter permease [Amycolatopsis]|uniref:Simple sugar transport system permease protein n=2 Tax=Amycolatopsis TaxID=1813 RepID=A0A1I3KD48_9PSEU|nr:ABC transporter permease [Amycolatopsis sacchari]SFI70439.1 simple sugar transport system permease protein [Amycolatopsis sacchari]
MKTDLAEPAATELVRPARPSLLARIKHLDHIGLLTATVLLFVVLSLCAPYFMTTKNLLNVLQQSAFVGVIALAMTFVIVAGEIDISVGSAMAFASSLFGVLVTDHGWSLPLAALAVLLVGAVTGLLAGLVRVWFDVPSFIVTLALFSILRGLAQMLTDAVPVQISSAGFSQWGNGDVFGVPVPAVIMFLFLAVSWFVLTRTTFGRSVFAVGGNPDAARLSGISVGRIRALVFGLTGAAAGLAGVLQSAQLSSGDSTIGVGAEFTAISAVIIGGASLFGGRGSVVGTFLGVIFLGLLNNGMVLLDLSSYAQGVARGVIVLLAVVISTRREGVRLRTLLGFVFRRARS